MRRLTLLAVLSAVFIGGLARYAAGGYTAFDAPSYNAEGFALAPGTPIGPFVFEARVGNGHDNLRLASASCSGPIFLGIEVAGARMPDEYLAGLYPAEKWRTQYIYQRRITPGAQRIKNYVHHLAAIVLAGFAASPRNLADDLYLVLRAPPECVLTSQETLATAEAMLELIRRRL